MKGLIVFYNVVTSVNSFDCLQRRNKHICRYSGCCLYSVVYILAAAEEQLSSVAFVYILASLRSSSLCLYSGCYGGAVLFRNFCLYSGVAEGQQPLPIFWLLRRSGSLQRFCLYSGVAARQQPFSIFWLRRRLIFRDFAYILALLRGSNLCPYSGCYGGAPMIEEANFADILGIARERFKHMFLLRPNF